MSSATLSYDPEWDELLRAWQDLAVPEGWRAEITDGGLTMSPPPGNGHNSISWRLTRALTRVMPDQWGIFHTLGISVPQLARLYEPDLVVMPIAELEQRPDRQPVPASEALLVVEIVSKSNARTDRVEKRRVYAHASVPLYLLVDRFDEVGPVVTLFSDPVDGHYRKSEQVSFGERIKIPAPIGLEVDTAEFR